MNFKALIFDVDGTLYKSSPALLAELENFRIKLIADCDKLSFEKAKEKYLKLVRQYKSTTYAVMKVLNIPLTVASEKIWQGVERSKYIKDDKKIVALMKSLAKRYRLFLMRNGTHKGTKEILKLLGFGKNYYNNTYYYSEVFERIFSVVEDFQTVKPDLLPFKKIVEYLKLSPDNILMIGDRINVDLTPAKKIGMQTALVTWGEKYEAHPDVDFYMKSVYDILELLGSDTNNGNYHANDTN